MSESGILGCICGCMRFAKTRGLSNACYVALAKRVQAGEITWEQAEAQGKCRRPKTQAERKDRFFMSNRGGRK